MDQQSSDYFQTPACRACTCIASAKIKAGAAALVVASILAPLNAFAAKPIEGFTQPFEVVNVAASEAGIIKSLEIKQGASVVSSQPIAILDNGVLRAALEAARAKAASNGPILAAQAAAKQRVSRLNHIKKLHENGHASPEELERAISDADIASANLITAQEEARANALQVKQIEAQIERRTIRSPINGVVSLITKRPGEFVTSIDATVATIVQIDKLRVIFHIPTEHVSQLRVNDNVEVRFATDGRKPNSTIEFVSPVTDAESNLVRLKS